MFFDFDSIVIAQSFVFFFDDLVCDASQLVDINKRHYKARTPPQRQQTQKGGK